MGRTGQVGIFHETWEACEDCMNQNKCEKLEMEPSLKVVDNEIIICEDFKDKEN